MSYMDELNAQKSALGSEITVETAMFVDNENEVIVAGVNIMGTDSDVPVFFSCEELNKMSEQAYNETQAAMKKAGLLG